jgi:hypothetical protein
MVFYNISISKMPREKLKIIKKVLEKKGNCHKKEELYMCAGGNRICSCLAEK